MLQGFGFYLIKTTMVSLKKKKVNVYSRSGNKLVLAFFFLPYITCHREKPHGGGLAFFICKTITFVFFSYILRPMNKIKGINKIELLFKVK